MIGDIGHGRARARIMPTGVGKVASKKWYNQVTADKETPEFVDRQMAEPPEAHTTSLSRWQFSLRALLIVMTLAAIVVAFVAKYQQVALLLTCMVVWALFESGAIFEIVLALAKPDVFERHAILATATWLLTGTLSLVLGGLFWWAALSPRSNAPFFLPLIPAVPLSCFGVYCFWLIWSSIRGSNVTSDSGKSDDR